MIQNLSFLTFLLVCFCGIGQDDLVITSETHQYTINDLENYTSVVEVRGENASSSTQYFVFPVSELTRVEHLQLDEFTGKKWKRSESMNSVTESTMSWSSFFSGTKKLIYAIKPFTKFKFYCSSVEKHTMFLTKFYKQGFYDSENVEYVVRLPKGLSITTSEHKKHIGTVSYTTEMFDSLEYISYLVHPEEQEPMNYFSDWFQERISPQLNISDESVPEELKEIAQSASKPELAEACFNFVQRKIKYIDIENGIHAIIPRQCENVLTNGMGDCKDMATLLTALYRYFGMEAYTAISRTNSKDGVFDFPTLGLANHTICALNLEGEWYFLDATEDACIFGDPSLQIMGTEVFLVGKTGDYFHAVTASNRSTSESELNYRIDSSEKKIYLEIKADGKMNTLFRHFSLKSNEAEGELEKMMKYATDLDWKLENWESSELTSTMFFSTPLNLALYSSVGDRTLYTSSFIIPLEKMLLIFQNNDYPLYSSEISVNLQFDGTLRGAFESSEHLMISQSADSINIKCSLSENKSLELFNQTSIKSDWINLFTKPITVLHHAD